KPGTDTFERTQAPRPPVRQASRASPDGATRAMRPDPSRPSCLSRHRLGAREAKYSEARGDRLSSSIFALRFGYQLVKRRHRDSEAAAEPHCRQLSSLNHFVD